MATSCFPVAVGVPGNSTPPNWLAGTSAPFDGSPDDPRWVGALSHSFGDGAGVQVLFRGLRDPGNTKLLLSWLVKVDPAVNAGNDALFVGIGNSAGTAGVIAIITLTNPGPITFGTSGSAYTPTAQLFSAGSWAGMTAPAWIASGTRVWINFGSPMTPWAVQMEVPINQFLDPGTNTVQIQPNVDFKMWYTAVLNSPAVPGADVQYQWPGTPLLVGFPLPSAFAPARVSNIAGDPLCTETGITLGVLDIGTKNVDGTARPDSSEIRFDQAGIDATAANHTNQFFAHPNFPAAIPGARKQQVRARFRLANWGSQIGTLTAASWKDIPGGNDVPCDTLQNGGESHFLWPTQTGLNSDPATQSLVNLFRLGTTTRDQCMLVELSSTFNGEVFLNNSIRRNMDLVGASKFSREAEISIVGLQAFSSVPRDVYLYLETVNMPAQVRGDFNDNRRGFAEAFNTLSVGASAAERPTPTIEDLVKLLPTYRVHVYHDTGLTSSIRTGSPRRILTAQASFGFFVHHDGSLTGWAARLQGAIRIAENFYLLRIENNGKAKITTAIQGIEPGEAVLPEDPIVPTPPRPDDGKGCLAAVLSFLKGLFKMH